MAEKFLPYTKNEYCVLDMGYCIVTENGCGTIACHAGYAAIIMGKGKIGTYYEDGKRLLAEYLGFKNPQWLKDWAIEYPEYWGNKWGDDMFAFPRGLCMQPGEENLAGVAAHYMLVAKNLMEIKE